MSKFLLFSCLFLGVVTCGYSQSLSFGVKAGVPLNDALSAVQSGPFTSLQTDRWIVGPTAELHLPFHLSFEVDALYRRESLQTSSFAGISQYSINNWQFPFLAKYEFRGGLLRPFIDGGVTYRHLSGGASADNAGLTVAGGVGIKVLFLRLSPEIRYTRWGSTSVLNTLNAQQAQNQADFLLGFSF